MIFKGLARIEQLVPFEVEVDEEEFAAWLEGADPTDESRAEYLRSSPDWWMDLSLEDPSWRHEVSDYDIERVTAHTNRDQEDIETSIAGETPWDREHAQDHHNRSTE